MYEKHQLAVVTGASSGIGRATARVLAVRGFHVFAGVRREQDAEQFASGGVEPVMLDITSPADVAAIRQRVHNDPLPLGALVNNAGVAVNAPVEVLPIEEWRRQFDVNFFGHVAVTQALLPALLQSGGRVVNISSIGGRVASPTFGAYAGSKFALEAMSDALRREVGRLGVHVIIVEPGTISTPIWSKGLALAQDLVSGISEEHRSRYGDLLVAATRQAEELERNGIDPSRVAQVIADAIATRKPRARYLVGRDANVIARVARVLPDRMMDRLIARNLGLANPAPAGAGTRDPQNTSELAVP